MWCSVDAWWNEMGFWCEWEMGMDGHVKACMACMAEAVLIAKKGSWLTI